MKSSQLFKLPNSPQKFYILGSLLAKNYISRDSKDIYFLAYNRLQKTNKHYFKQDDFVQLEKFLKKILFKTKKISETKKPKFNSGFKFDKNCIGIFATIKNDLKLDYQSLISEITNIALKSEPEYAKWLIIGVFDSKGSPDCTIKKVAVDLEKNNATLLALCFENILNFTDVKILNINLNPRATTQSWRKNPQFRLPLDAFLIFFGFINNSKFFWCKDKPGTKCSNFYDYETTQENYLKKLKNNDYLKKINILNKYQNILKVSRLGKINSIL